MGACQSVFKREGGTVVPEKNKVADIYDIFTKIRDVGEGASCMVEECVFKDKKNNQVMSNNKNNNSNHKESSSSSVAPTNTSSSNNNSSNNHKIKDNNNNNDHQINESETCLKIALKKLQKSKLNRQLFEREVSILRLLKHDNILEYLDCYSDHQYYCISTVLYCGGELFDRIIAAKKFTEKMASSLVQQMLLAIEHCHDRGVAHRDLKPENFVFENDDLHSNLRLIDFGVARKVEDDDIFTDIVGTPFYLAPENLKGSARTGKVIKASDLWSIGVITYILVTGQPPFNGKNNQKIFSNIVKSPVRFPTKIEKHISDELKDFIISLLNKKPGQRPSVKEALNHPWIIRREQLSDVDISSQVMGFLSKFKHETHLKKALADVVIHYAPQSDVETLKEMFNKVDNDGDGQLTEGELATVLINMGYYKAQAENEARNIMDKCDADGDGRLTFTEFSHVHASIQLSNDEMLIHTCFQVMDDNGDGQLSIEELQSALKLTDEEVKRVFEESDLNGDGVISFSEFQHAMKTSMDKDELKASQLIAGVGMGSKNGPRQSQMPQLDELAEINQQYS